MSKYPCPMTRDCSLSEIPLYGVVRRRLHPPKTAFGSQGGHACGSERSWHHSTAMTRPMDWVRRFHVFQMEPLEAPLATEQQPEAGLLESRRS